MHRKCPYCYRNLTVTVARAENRHGKPKGLPQWPPNWDRVVRGVVAIAAKYGRALESATVRELTRRFSAPNVAAMTDVLEAMARDGIGDLKPEGRNHRWVYVIDDAKAAIAKCGEIATNGENTTGVETETHEE